jgi:carbamoyl-phosphate synthase large subunit
MKEQINVLFCSAGRRVELLRAFRRAYESLSLPGRMIGIDIDPLAPALQLCDRFYMVPKLKSPEYIPQVVEVCRKEEISMIVPLIDPEIPLLAEHRVDLEETGARLLVVPPEAARLTADKWRTTKFFERLNLRTPRSWLPGEIGGIDFEFPVFIKPRFGSAAQHTFQVRNRNELEFFANYVPDAIIQEFLPGPEITSDVICDLDGELLAMVSRKRIEVRWGEVAKGVTVCYPEILTACRRIAQELPAIGPVTVQCMIKENIPHFTEINARFGGGAPLGIAAGVDSPRYLLARLAKINIDIPPAGDYQAGLYLTRYDDSFFIDERKKHEMESHHI